MIADNAFFPIENNMTLIEYYLRLEEILYQESKYKFWHFIRMFQQYLIDKFRVHSLVVVRENSVKRDIDAKYPEMLYKKLKNKQANFFEFCKQQLKNCDLDAVKQEIKEKVYDQTDEDEKGKLAFMLYFENFSRHKWFGIIYSFPKLVGLNEKLDKIKPAFVYISEPNMNGQFQWCFNQARLFCDISIKQIKLKTLKYCVILTSNLNSQAKT